MLCGLNEIMHRKDSALCPARSQCSIDVRYHTSEDVFGHTWMGKSVEGN